MTVHLRPHVLSAIRQSLDLEPTDASKDNVIAAMSLRELLNHYLGWEGVHGYTDAILSIMTYSTERVTH